MKKIIFTILFLFSLSAYSQTVLVDEKKDTTICFTINQSKFLLKEHYKYEECSELLIVAEKQIIAHDSLNMKNESIIDSQRKVIKNQSITINNNKIQKDTLISENNQLKVDWWNERKKKNIYKGGFFGLLAVLIGGIIIK